MHIALVNGVRTPPSTGLSGQCPVCEREMIAKCGEIRVHHWAHRGRRICDHWWEPETEWHRNWKNNFEIGWHENIRFADDGEKHIADIRTPHELVVEFQHSAISADERKAREAFYGNMVWVVDGTRLVRDFPRLDEQRHFFGKTSHQAVFLTERPEKCFPKQWLDSSVPVFFDFKVDTVQGPEANVREWLWCLLPGRAEDRAVIALMSRAEFVQAVSSGPMVINSAHFVESLARSLRINKEIEAQRTYLGTRTVLVPRWTRYGGARRRRRF
jgi:competence protein CoiA